MEKDTEKIGGIELERWKQAFAQLVDIAIDQDYFSDILSFDLFPNSNDWNAMWKHTDKAYEKVFGFKRREA